MARGERYRYRAQIRKHGEPVFLRRYSGPAGPSRPKTDYKVRAWVKGFDPHTLIGNLVYGDRRVIVLAEDVELSGVALPIVARDDTLVIRGREMAIGLVDDSTHRDGGKLVAFEMKVAG